MERFTRYQWLQWIQGNRNIPKHDHIICKTIAVAQDTDMVRIIKSATLYLHSQCAVEAGASIQTSDLRSLADAQLKRAFK